MADLNISNSDEAEKNMLFEVLFDLMPQLGWTARADGFIDFYNKQWFDFTGLTFEQLKGWGWECVHDPTYLPEVKKRWIKSIEAGSEFEMEFPLRAADGKFQWFLTRITPLIKDGKVVRWIGINTNIDTERRASAQLEQEIRARAQEVESIGNILSTFVESGDVQQASRQTLHLALEMTKSEYGFVGVVVPGGPNGVTLRIIADEGFNWSETENRALYEKIVLDYKLKGYIEFPMLDNLFGWPILHGKPILSNSPSSDSRRSGRSPKGHPPIKNYLGLPILKGDNVVGSFGIANREGGYNEEQIVALQMISKTIAVIYESYRRMSQEQVLISERMVAEENLREANQTLIDLAYTITHELQDPLAKIRSQLNLLSARYTGRLGEDADNFIKVTIRSATVVDRVIDDLWEFARIELPHIKFDLVDMGELFDAVVNTFKNQIAEKHAVIRRDDMPKVYGERRQLELLLKHLLLNGLTFNKSPNPQINLSTSALGDELEFCLEDDGIGFDKSEAGEIFKMFKKLSKDYGGTGMGLAICKKIIEFHGGKIWAESSVDGSKFHFTLPITPIR